MVVQAPSDMVAEQEHLYYGQQHNDTPLCKYCNLNSDLFSDIFCSKKLVSLLRDTHGRSIHDDWSQRHYILHYMHGSK
jgi:hypothetical protein